MHWRWTNKEPHALGYYHIRQVIKKRRKPGFAEGEQGEESRHARHWRFTYLHTHTLFWEFSRIHGLLAANLLRMRSCDNAFVRGGKKSLHVGIWKRKCVQRRERTGWSFLFDLDRFFLVIEQDSNLHLEPDAQPLRNLPWFGNIDVGRSRHWEPPF